MYTVYKHTSPSGKVYIGITSTSVNKRWANGKGYKNQSSIANAIKKYGWENFQHEILAENLDSETAYAMEMFFIKKYKSNKKEFGYNLSIGGEKGSLGVVRTENYKKLMSETRTGKNNPFYGRKHTKQTLERMKISQGGKNHPMYNKRHSEETKLKMSQAHKGEKCYWYGKKRDQKTINAIIERSRKPIICVETNEYFKSCKEAMISKEIKSKTSISNCLNGRSRTAGGYHWKYATKEEKYSNEGTTSETLQGKF